MRSWQNLFKSYRALTPANINRSLAKKGYLNKVYRRNSSTRVSRYLVQASHYSKAKADSRIWTNHKYARRLSPCSSKNVSYSESPIYCQTILPRTQTSAKHLLAGVHIYTPRLSFCNELTRQPCIARSKQDEIREKARDSEPHNSRVLAITCY